MVCYCRNLNERLSVECLRACSVHPELAAYVVGEVKDLYKYDQCERIIYWR